MMAVAVAGSLFIGANQACTVEAAEIGNNADIIQEGMITSGMGAVDNGILYYAIATGGMHTDLIARNLATGKEEKIVSIGHTNGFSSISVYDGYIYCVWDKYVGTDNSNYQIYRFSLNDYSGQYIADGYNPIVADRTLYYWTSSLGENWDTEYGVLHSLNIDTLLPGEDVAFPRNLAGVDSGYCYHGIADCYIVNGNYLVALSYDELGEYNEEVGGYLWSDDLESGVKIFDMNGNEYNPADYGIVSTPYYSDGSCYGLTTLINRNDIQGGGIMALGFINDKEALNYIDSTGNIITLKTWEPAE